LPIKFLIQADKTTEFCIIQLYSYLETHFSALNNRKKYFCFFTRIEVKILLIMNLFVGNLSPETNEQSLRDLFSEFGAISSVKIIIDPQTGMPKGFGFVEMEEKFSAFDAIDNLDATYFQGTIISVKEAKSNKTASRPGGGGGGNRPFQKKPGGYQQRSGGFNPNRQSGNFNSNRSNGGGYNSNRNNEGGGFNANRSTYSGNKNFNSNDQ
jgi:RNA recognition motif-containing protein